MPTTLVFVDALFIRKNYSGELVKPVGRWSVEQARWRFNRVQRLPLEVLMYTTPGMTGPFSSSS